MPSLISNINNNLIFPQGCPRILISGDYSAFKEGWNGAGIYMFSGLYGSQTFRLPAYIGSAQDLQFRIECQHIFYLNRNEHPHNPALQHAWTKHGSENFVVWCLEVCSIENLLLTEQKYLDLYRPFADEFGGFNIAHYAHCPTRPKGEKRKPLSLEHKEKLRIANMGKKHSEEHKRKISESQKGERSYWFGKKWEDGKHPMLGKNHSEESKSKMSLSKKGLYTIFRVISPEGKLIEDSNVRKFCKVNDLSRTCFRRLLDGKIKNYKGWSLPQ